MARDTITIAAPPGDVFAVLSEARAYGDWVVGPGVQSAEPSWPRPGSALVYQVGFGPLSLSDRTVVVDVDPPRRVELRAFAGPFPPAAITIELEQAGDGTLVTLDERPAQRLIDLLSWPLGHLAVSLRNQWALGRLKRLVETRG